MSLLESFSVVLTGISVVFLTLILLVAILTLMGTLQRKPPQDTKISPDQLPQSQDTSPLSAATPYVEAGISDEVVAVISASLATVTAPDVSYQVKSIRRSKGSRTAWAQAGLNESTQSF